jgi:oligoendopeptidase F
MLLLLPLITKAQSFVIHNDLIATQLTNSSYKIAWNELYGQKLDAIKNHREQTASCLGVIQQVQEKIFQSLSNVDDAIKNGKALFYISKKIPLIFTNLQKSVVAAVGKPYSLVLVSNQIPIFTVRLTNLTSYLNQQVLGTDENILMDQAARDRFVRNVYDEINVLYQLSNSMYRTIESANFQDAVNKIVPFQTYINIDNAIIQDILFRFKF